MGGVGVWEQGGIKTVVVPAMVGSPPKDVPRSIPAEPRRVREFPPWAPCLRGAFPLVRDHHFRGVRPERLKSLLRTDGLPLL